MFLYHGTSSTALTKILKEGIQPRAVTESKSMWDIESAPDRVYLSDTYAQYFAICAAGEVSDTDDAVIIKVKVDENLLLPDEDYMAQVYKRSDNLFEDTKYYRDFLFNIYNKKEIKNFAEESLAKLGTVAIREIKLSDIISYTIIPEKQHARFILSECDPSISILNHKFCNFQYKSQLENLHKRFETIIL